MRRPRMLLLCLLLCGVRSMAQDSTTLQVDSVMEPQKVYAEQEKALWEPGRFDSIAVNTKPFNNKTPAYKDVIGRYEDPDFVYSENIKDRIGVLERIFSRLAHWLGSLFPQNAINWNREFTYIFACIALVALAFILYKVLYKRNVFYRQEEREDEQMRTVDYVEKNLMEVNLAPYINEAERTQNYALGIRYLQLLSIQMLAHAGQIRWKASKTNADFSAEIQKDTLREGFENLTKVFNRVWFGKFELKESDFQAYRKMFYDYQQHIK